MTEKFQNKYRITSHRHPDWDYSWNALYFLTIVTQNKACNLGKILDHQMILSDFGKIVNDEWLKSFEIRKELILHEYIIMPNHLHAVVEICNKSELNHPGSVETHGRASHHPNSQPQSISLNNNLLQIKRNPAIRIPKSISTLMAGFKSAVTTKIDNYIDENRLRLKKYHQYNPFFQANYHDHIIRNDFEFQNIRNYILENPINWEKDKLFCQ